MRTNPFTDAWLFLTGQQGSQTALGLGHWPIVVLFDLLVLGSVVIAAMAWAEDPAQRTGRDLATWAMRALVGAMWFDGSLWKLPLFTTDNGLHYWTQQEVGNAAFQFHRDLVANILLPTPQYYVLNVAVLLAEIGFAASLLLGLGVRLMGAVGVVFVAQLWLGLYLQPQEWPWTYVFLGMLMALFSVYGAGRSLGLDGLLRRRYPPDLTDGVPGLLVRAIT